VSRLLPPPLEFTPMAMTRVQILKLNYWSKADGPHYFTEFVEWVLWKLKHTHRSKRLYDRLLGSERHTQQLTSHNHNH
jgi:hypothetical protein